MKESLGDQLTNVRSDRGKGLGESVKRPAEGKRKRELKESESVDKAREIRRRTRLSDSALFAIKGAK